jgi:hypothetical protein
MLREEVTEVDIADIVAKWTGIPVSKLVASEREKLLHLNDVLHQRVVGQDEAVEAVADAIQRWDPSDNANPHFKQQPADTLMHLIANGCNTSTARICSCQASCRHGY